MQTKTFQIEETTGELRIFEMDPQFGEVNRPATRFEAVAQKAKGFVRELIVALGAEAQV